MDLSAWASDRVLESFFYSGDAAGLKPTDTGHFTHAPLTKQQLAFNAVCDHSARSLLADLEAGIAPLDAVDALFDDPKWVELTAEMFWFHKDEPDRPALREQLRDRFPWAVQVPVSPPTKQIALKCLEALNAVYFAHEHLDAAGVKIPASTSDEDQATDHLWFLSDPKVPRALRRGLLAHRRGSVALIATYPWTAPRLTHLKQALEMLKLTTACFREYLGVLANIPEAQITLVAPDRSATADELRTAPVDVLHPFREALQRDGGGRVVEPA